MTVKELAIVAQFTTIKLLSARTGKVLCYRFDDEQHERLANSDVLSVWAEISVNKSQRNDYARAILCAYIPEPPKGVE